MEAKNLKNLRNPWTAEEAREERERVRREVATLIEKKGIKAAFPDLMSRIAESASSVDSPAEQLRSLMLIAETIELDRTGNEISNTALKKINDLSRMLLNRYGIPVNGDPLSFLHRENNFGLAQRSLQSNPWESLVRVDGHHVPVGREARSNRLVPVGGQSAENLLEAKSLLRLGAADRALLIFGAIDSAPPKDQQTLLFAQLWQIRCLRLNFALDAAIAKTTEILANNTLNSGELRQVQWEALFNEAIKKGSILGPLKEIGRNRPLRTFRPMLLTWLWAHALPHEDFHKQLPSSRSLREAAPSDSPFEQRDEILANVRCVELLEFAYDKDYPLLDRSVAVAEAMNLNSTICDPEPRLLTMAACARWFTRHGYTHLGIVAGLTYKQQCAMLSRQRCSDLFRVLSDLPLTDTSLTPEVGTGLETRDFAWIARSIRMSSFAIGTTGSIVKSRIKQSVSHPKNHQKIIDKEIAEHAARIRDYLKIAKGTLLKTTQAMVFFDTTLPEPIARELRNLTLNVVPLDHTLSRKIIESELGRSVTDVFESWSPYPFSAASIGQVHRARLKNGKDVAVKVQYPKMREQIYQEQVAVKLLSPVVKFFYPSADIDRAINEVIAMLLEETDYKRELHYLTRAWEASLSIKGIRVPKPIPELSTSRVLTMEYLDGARFWEFVRGVNQEERNRVADLIVRSHFEMRYKHGIVNFDPHPGNYLFGSDYVGLIDFGSASDDNAEMLADFKSLYQVLKAGDKSGALAELTRIGFVGNLKNFDIEAAWEQLQADFAPFLSERPVKINLDVLRASLRSFAKNQKAWALPPKWLGHFRANLAMYAVVSALDAEVNMNQISREFLDK